MRITVLCNSCHQDFTVQAKRAGHRVACKLCGAVVRVPDEIPAKPVMLRRIYSDSETMVQEEPTVRVKVEPQTIVVGVGAVVAIIAIVMFIQSSGSQQPAPVSNVPTPLSAPVPAMQPPTAARFVTPAVDTKTADSMPKTVTKNSEESPAVDSAPSEQTQPSTPQNGRERVGF